MGEERQTWMTGVKPRAKPRHDDGGEAALLCWERSDAAIPIAGANGMGIASLRSQ
jgi:hypothetical protein